VTCEHDIVLSARLFFLAKSAKGSGKFFVYAESQTGQLTRKPRFVNNSPSNAKPSLLRSSLWVARTLRSLRRTYHRICRSRKDFSRSSAVVHDRPVARWIRKRKRLVRRRKWRECGRMLNAPDLRFRSFSMIGSKLPIPLPASSAVLGRVLSSSSVNPIPPNGVGNFPSSVVLKNFQSG
jgi:hypothetical protein